MIFGNLTESATFGQVRVLADGLLEELFRTRIGFHALFERLLKERRDKNLVHVSDKLGELFRSAALNFFETFRLSVRFDYYYIRAK